MMTDLLPKLDTRQMLNLHAITKTFNTETHRALSIHYFHSEILFLFVIIRSTQSRFDHFNVLVFYIVLFSIKME